MTAGRGIVHHDMLNITDFHIICFVFLPGIVLYICQVLFCISARFCFAFLPGFVLIFLPGFVLIFLPGIVLHFCQVLSTLRCPAGRKPGVCSSGSTCQGQSGNDVHYKMYCNDNDYDHLNDDDVLQSMTMAMVTWL